MQRIVLMAIFIVILMFPKETFAIVDPLSTTNNKFGIHIISDNDIDEADALVNSSGGDWGYVTIVIRSDERDTSRWQRVFDELRHKHLIPLVRIASTQGTDGWDKLDIQDIQNWIKFFDSLNWVVQNRYVIVGNEVNHAGEWGGSINPEEYAQYLRKFFEVAKASNNDYFVLPAGLDASAPNSRDYMSETNYLSQMKQADSEIFSYIDGWNSHSYPNPNFSGSSSASGLGTVFSYDWELKYLKGLGVERELPVFITETGWKHDIGGSVLGYKSETEIADEYTNAFTGVWNDSRIVAITPFILGYSDQPFEQFSWKKEGGGYYEFYNRVKEIEKEQGEPVQISAGEFEFVILPSAMGADGLGVARVRNTGQNIWSPGDQILIDTDKAKVEIQPMKYLDSVEPGHIGLVFFKNIAEGNCGDGCDEGYSLSIDPTTSLSQFRGIASIILSSEYEAGRFN